MAHQKIRSNKKFGLDRFSCFDVNWMQTNKQTDRQAQHAYIYMKKAFATYLPNIVRTSVLMSFQKMRFLRIAEQAAVPCSLALMALKSTCKR